MNPIDSVKIDILIEMAEDQQSKLCRLRELRLQGGVEVAAGGLTQETCEKISKLYRRTERNSIRIYNGVMSLHQSDSEYIPEGMSEGNKEWPP